MNITGAIRSVARVTQLVTAPKLVINAGLNVAQQGEGATPPLNNSADASALSVKGEALRLLGKLRDDVAGSSPRVPAGAADLTARQIAGADASRTPITLPLAGKKIWIAGGVLVAVLLVVLFVVRRRAPVPVVA